MRVGELLGLRRKDITLFQRSLVLNVRKSKTGANQPVIGKDEGVVSWFYFMYESMDLEAPLITTTYYPVRARLRTVLAAIGVTDRRYVWHSLRHGGATMMYLRDVPLENIALAGRSLSLTTARRYVQQGAALLTNATLPQRLTAAAVRLTETWPKWAQPGPEATSTPA